VADTHQAQGVGVPLPAQPRVIEGSCCGGHKARSPGIKHLVLDIEGTTTSISFVHDVLFPYAKAAVQAHVR
jgi:hypothetical protein